MAGRIISLNSGWTVTGTWPYAPILCKSLETGSSLRGITSAVPARVPGCVQADLLRSGLISDPYVKDNSLLCEWMETKWWIYETTFRKPDWDDKIWLCFDGLDYTAHIYLNQQELCVHEGTFLPLQLDVTNLLQSESENNLRVVFEECPREIGLGYTSRVHTQKPRFCYHWDFSTRLIPTGIWDNVYLRLTRTARITEASVTTDYNEKGEIWISVVSEGKAQCLIELFDPEGILLESRKLPEAELSSICLMIPEPRLWYPFGYGEQPLYRIRITLITDGISDQREYRAGIRSLRYLANENAPPDAMPYTVEINGKRIYLKGVNLVPFDQLYGTVDEEKYRRYADLLRAGNINLVRIWGGGLIEKELFYDLCDRYGILIWQEFIQSSSGVENVPPQDDTFLAILSKTSVWALKTKRNHVSLTMWCGGNELRKQFGSHTPVTLENKNIALLNRLVKQYDPQRIFYPSSASGPYEYLDEGKGGHDVHGYWRYAGLTEHYRIYNKADNLLHSESGADGMSDITALRYILQQDTPILHTADEDLVWRFHADAWDNLELNRKLFGDFSSTEEFIAASQWMQAEAVRYIVESDMRRAWRNSGTFVWQFNEPWPNISCTNLVQHNGSPKPAYYAVRNSYAPVAASLRYDTINPCENREYEYSLWLHSFGHAGSFTVAYELHDDKNDVMNQKTFTISADNRSVCVWSFSIKSPITKSGLFFIRLFVNNNGDKIHENQYIFSSLHELPLRPLLPILYKKKETNK